MSTRPRIFLDTSVLKLAASHVIRGFPRTTTVQWGGKKTTVPVTQFRVVPKVPKAGTAQASDAALLPIIAHVATHRRVELLWHLDGWMEFAGLPNTDSPRGTFFGAPLTWVKSPLAGGRVIADGQKPMADHQLEFLLSQRDQRFLDLQIAVGVKAGAKNYSNQLLDAWHIRCAEAAQADYFLTCDYKLIRHLESHRRFRPSVTVVVPRSLLRALLQRREVSILDIGRAVGSEWWRRVRRLPRRGDEDLAALGEHLERSGYYD